MPEPNTFHIEEIGDMEDSIWYRLTCTCGHVWDVYMEKVTEEPNPYEEVCPNCDALEEEYEA